MTLAEAYERLLQLPQEGVIYARRIDGSFRPESECVVLLLTEDQLALPVFAVADQFAPGMDYFLEVEIAAPFAEHARAAGASEASLARLIQYAENDA
jgi:hypothetical protein